MEQRELDFAKARNCKLRGFSRLFKQFRSRSPTTNAVVPPRLNSTRLIGQGDETWCRYAMPVTLHHHYILRGLNTRCVVSSLRHFYQVIFILFVDFSEFCFCTYNGETSQWFLIVYCEPMQKGGFLIVKHILRRIIHHVLISMFNNIHKKWVNLAHERMSVKHSVLGISHSWAILKECLILHWWHIPFATYQDSPSVIGESDIVYNNCDAVAPGQRDSGAAQRD